MSSKFGGKQGKLRDTQIKEVGPYRSVIEVEDVQSMSFKEGDRGPFYLVDDNHQMKRKFDRSKGEKNMVTKSKKEINRELKMKGVLECVKKSSVELFVAQCCQYMFAYLNLSKGENKLTYNMIEHFVKVSKTHRNIMETKRRALVKKQS